MHRGDECPLVRAERREEWQIPDPKDLPDDEFRRVEFGFLLAAGNGCLATMGSFVDTDALIMGATAENLHDTRDYPAGQEVVRAVVKRTELKPYITKAFDFFSGPVT